MKSIKYNVIFDTIRRINIMSFPFEEDQRIYEEEVKPLLLDKLNELAMLA